MNNHSSVLSFTVKRILHFLKKHGVQLDCYSYGQNKVATEHCDIAIDFYPKEGDLDLITSDNLGINADIIIISNPYELDNTSDIMSSINRICITMK